MRLFVVSNPVPGNEEDRDKIGEFESLGIYDCVTLRFGTRKTTFWPQELEEIRMEVKDVLAVFEETNEFGNIGRLVGIYDMDKRDLANGASNGAGFWGGVASVRNMKAVKIGGLAVLVHDKCPQAVRLNTNLIITDEQKRKNALAKLTDEDRRVLGIKP